MSYFHSDELCVWRRSCLLAEALEALRSEISGEDHGLPLENACRLSVRFAALIAASASTDLSQAQKLNHLIESSACLQALLAEMILLEELDIDPAEELSVWQSHAAELTVSVASLIRSLRSPE